MKLKVEKLKEFTGHKGSVFAMSMDSAGNHFYTSGDDGIVVAWDLNSEKDEGKALMRAHAAIYSVLLIEELDALIAGASDGTFFYINLSEGQLLHTRKSISEAIYNLYYQPENGWLWILYAKGYLDVWDLKNMHNLHRIRLGEENLRSIISGLEPSQLIIGSSDHSISVLDTENMKKVANWKAHDNSVFSLDMHTESKYLISGGRDAQLKLWDLQKDWQLREQIPAHMYTINQISFSDNYDFFATASRDKTIKVWDSYTLELLKVINAEKYEGHYHSVNKISWRRNLLELVSCSDDRRIIHWRLEISN